MERMNAKKPAKVEVEPKAEIGVDQAAEAIQKDKQVRMEGYIKAMSEAGEKYRCGIQAYPAIEDGKIVAKVTVVAV